MGRFLGEEEMVVLLVNSSAGCPVAVIRMHIRGVGRRAAELLIIFGHTVRYIVKTHMIITYRSFLHGQLNTRRE